jgi:hypothetical protein
MSERNKAESFENVLDGRMKVTGKITAYFEDTALLNRIMDGKRATGHWLSVPRKWKRKQRRLIEATYTFKSRPSIGWRRHVRKMKAKSK